MELTPEELQKSLDDLKIQLDTANKDLEGYKSLGTVDDFKSAKDYSELGSPEELRDKLEDYEALLKEREELGDSNYLEGKGIDKDTLEIRAGLLKAFPELASLLGKDAEDEEKQEVYIESSIDLLSDLAKKAGMSLESEDDVYYLASLVTSQIQRDSKEHKKYIAGDLKTVERAFWAVAEKIYGKKRASEDLIEGLPKIGGKGAGLGAIPLGEAHKSLDEATSKAYERFKSLQTEEA